jgi:hypothetical protein
MLKVRAQLSTAEYLVDGVCGINFSQLKRIILHIIGQTSDRIIGFGTCFCLHVGGFKLLHLIPKVAVSA